MISDIFAKRYPQALLHGDGVPPDLQRLLNQAAQLILHDLVDGVGDRAKFFEDLHWALSRELGAGLLREGREYEQICLRYLTEPYDLWNNAHGRPDSFFKNRLSLVELAFRRAEEIGRDLMDKAKERRKNPIRGRGLRVPMGTGPIPDNLSSVTDAIDELNGRFREAGAPLSYHNGLIQLVDDQVTTEQIEAPFWELVSDTKWANVDHDMKEAIDRRDAGKGDAGFFALKALESVIKVISDERGWTKGTERGAAAYVDNLVSSKNGRFIEAWEADALKRLFSDVRNPQGHGPGADPMPSLAEYQSTCVIETAMAWVKSLVRRP